MRQIVKTHPPKELLEWLKENESLDRSYGALQGKPAHVALKKYLLKEQGYLCAYTGRKVDSCDTHVEHIKPQTMCEGLEDVEYRNMLACFPSDGGNEDYGYGATIKGGDWQEDLFVSPCSENCERRFTHSWKGKISATDSQDEGANYTIQLIQLGDDSLSKMRHKAILGFFGFSANPKIKQLSTAEGKALLPKIDVPDSSGHLRAFCFVLKQLLPKFIKDQ